MHGTSAFKPASRRRMPQTSPWLAMHYVGRICQTNPDIHHLLDHGGLSSIVNDAIQKCVVTFFFAGACFGDLICYGRLRLLGALPPIRLRRRAMSLSRLTLRHDCCKSFFGVCPSHYSIHLMNLPKTPSFLADSSTIRAFPRI